LNFFYWNYFTEYNKLFHIDENIAVNEEPMLEFGIDEAVTEWYAEGLLYKFDTEATPEQTGKTR